MSVFTSKVVTYAEVLHAARETAERIMAARSTTQRRTVHISARGGMTASVIWDAHDANINLPSLPADTKLTRDEADRILGFLVHEISHPLHTDWQQWSNAVAAGEMVKTFTNVVEDLRIENIEITSNKLPGYKGLISGTTRDLHARILREWAEEGVKPGDAGSLVWTFAYAGRAAVHNMDLDGAGDLMLALPPSLLPLFRKMVAAVPTLADTDASRAIAEEIVATLGSLPPQGMGQPGQPQDGGEGEGQPQAGEGQPQDGEGQLQPQGAPEKAAEGDGEGQGQGTAETEAQPQGEAEGGGAGKPRSLLEEVAQSGDPQDDMSKLMEELAEKIEDLAEKIQGIGRGGHISLDYVPPRIVGQVPTLASGKRRATTLRNRVKGAALARDQLMTMVKSESRAGWDEHQERGRLDPRAMARVRMGKRDVFRRRWTEEGTETAVCVLIDMSSSMMHGSRVASAQAMALTVCDAVDLANGKVAVLGFGDGYHHHGMTCSLHVMRDWNTAKPKADAAIVAWQATHSTPLSPAIVGASEWMRRTVQADRYVLIVMTDGGCNFGPDNTKAACQIAVHKHGVEVCAILCECGGWTQDAFQGFPCVNVESAGNLGKETLRSLAKQVADQQYRM